MKTTTRSVALAAALALALAACAGDDADVADDEPTTSPEDTAAGDDGEDEETEAEGAETEDAADGPVSVAVDGTELGNILVDGDGMTLYLFDMDDQGQSQCADDCAENWPPLTTDGDPIAEGGADADLLGTVERDDGSLQVTYDGWPLYHFIADQEPGDVEGQAVQDVWWVLDAAGEPLREGADTEGEMEESDSAGY